MAVTQTEPHQMITFDQVISPLTRADFISDFWTKSFLRLPGQTGRFQGLLTWNELNSILEQDRFDPTQLQLFQDGKPVDLNQYTIKWKGSLRLNSGGFIACLSRGATLVLNFIDNTAPNVRELAEFMSGCSAGLLPCESLRRLADGERI